MSLLLLFQGANIYPSSDKQYYTSGTEIVFPKIEEEIIKNDDEEVFSIIKKIVGYL